MYRKRNKGITQTVLQVLGENQNRTVSCKEIYAEVKRRLLLTPEQLEITYERPRFHHSVRCSLFSLTRTGEIIRVGKGEYRKATSYDKAKKQTHN